MNPFSFVSNRFLNSLRFSAKVGCLHRCGMFAGAAVIFFAVTGWFYPVLAEEAAAVPAVRILHPRDGSLVRNELNHIVARVDSGKVSYVVVRVNDQITPVIDVTTKPYRDLFKNVVLVRIYLLRGENEIEVTVKDEEGKDLESRKLKVFYADPFDAEAPPVPEGYSVKPMHDGKNEEECKECHKMDVDPATDIDPAGKYDLFCVRCHEAGMAEDRPHGSATWKCLYCHNYKGKVRYGLRDEKGSFCVECHRDEVDAYLSMKSIHSSVKKEECLLCHRNHGGEWKGLISAPVNRLCYDCHKAVYNGTHITPGHPLEAQKDPSREGEEFNCLSCHDPHASNIRALMRYEPGMAMCQACHVK